MKPSILVIGGGVIGVTTAYWLDKLGAKVTILEQSDTLADGASFANGGQLSYSFTDALANPALLKRLPSILLGLDPAIRIRPTLDPELIRWSIRFLRNCTSAKADQITLKLLEYTARSASLMQEFASLCDSGFDHRAAGKLVLLHHNDVPQASRISRIKQQQGFDVEVISSDEARKIEPALETWTEPFDAAVWARNDESGDSNKFVAALGEQLGKRDVSISLGQTIHSLLEDDGRLTGVLTNGHIHNADAVVVCAGNGSRSLCATVGLRLPVYPMTGYSLTFPVGRIPLQRSVTLSRRKVVLTRLGDRIRIAGFLDIGVKRAQPRIDQLRKLALEVAPTVADFSASGSHWTGNRPMTPDGLPLIGKTSIPGLYLNTGQGMLGWTVAAATGAKTARIVMQDFGVEET